MTTPEMDNENIVRLIDIIGDGDLTAEAQERLHQEGLWPHYESLRQTAYAAFVFGHADSTIRALPTLPQSDIGRLCAAPLGVFLQTMHLSGSNSCWPCKMS